MEIFSVYSLLPPIFLFDKNNLTNSFGKVIEYSAQGEKKSICGIMEKIGEFVFISILKSYY